MLDLPAADSQKKKTLRAFAGCRWLPPDPPELFTVPAAPDPAPTPVSPLMQAKPGRPRKDPDAAQTAAERKRASRAKQAAKAASDPNVKTESDKLREQRVRAKQESAIRNVLAESPNKGLFMPDAPHARGKLVFNGYCTDGEGSKQFEIISANSQRVDSDNPEPKMRPPGRTGRETEEQLEKLGEGCEEEDTFVKTKTFARNWRLDSGDKAWLIREIIVPGIFRLSTDRQLARDEQFHCRLCNQDVGLWLADAREHALAKHQTHIRAVIRARQPKKTAKR